MINEIADFNGNENLRKEWQTWGRIMSEDVIRTLSPQLYADLLDGVDVKFQWHIIVIGFLRLRGVTTSGGRRYADELQICLNSRRISPPVIDSGDPLVNCHADVSGCSSLGVYTKKGRKTCETEFATCMQSQHVRITSMPGCGIAEILVDLTVRLQALRLATRLATPPKLAYGCAVWGGNDLVKHGKLLYEMPGCVEQAAHEMFSTIARDYDCFVFVIPGDAALWGLDARFDEHNTAVEQIAMQYGVLVVDGMPCWQRLTMKHAGGWHATDTPDNRQLMSKFLRAALTAASSTRPPAVWRADPGRDPPPIPARPPPAITVKAPPVGFPPSF